MIARLMMLLEKIGWEETKMCINRIQEAPMKRVSEEMHHCKPGRQRLFSIKGGSYGAY
jgi:hypothetical protein